MNSSVRYGPFLSKALPNHSDAATKIWPDSSILLPSHSSYRRGITLEFYRQRHGIQPDTIFTIDLKERAQQLRIFRASGGEGQPGRCASGLKTSPPLYCMPLLCNILRW